MKQTTTYQGRLCNKCGTNERYVKENRCVKCRSEWKKTEIAKNITKRYQQSSKGKAYRKQYQQTTKRKEYLEKWNKSEHGKKSRRYEHVKRTYNLTAEQYDALLNTQSQRCPICQILLERPYVDHNHVCCPNENSCGQCVRGLLCFTCNRLLANCKDNPEILKRAISYLQKEGPLSSFIPNTPLAPLSTKKPNISSSTAEA